MSLEELDVQKDRVYDNDVIGVLLTYRQYLCYF
jgi:hypothetical protein